MYYLYILQCKDKSLYTGITTDIARRLKEHQEGKGGHYTRSHGAEKMLHIEPFPTRSAASAREFEVKQLRREAKLALIGSGKKPKHLL
ncbi:MAG: GIY-YIG nuclease family protein [Candidatus Pacebacteria bacterium]|nr:GIY-YIG nuclease family protein [Candidatus Paceibacterota bacterium]